MTTEFYKNCTDLNAVYPYGVKIGHPAYRPGLDRDHDGVACEQPGKEGQATPGPSKSPSPTPSQSATASPSASPSKSPSVSPSPSKTATAPPTSLPPVEPSPSKTTAVVVGSSSEKLPLTGPGEAAVAGAGVLLVGVLLFVVFRRRKPRFTS